MCLNSFGNDNNSPLSNIICEFSLNNFSGVLVINVGNIESFKYVTVAKNGCINLLFSYRSSSLSE